MKRLKSLVLVALAVIVGVAFVVPAAPASAQSASLSIVPRKNYTIEPGKSIRDTITIRNLDAEKTLDLVLRVVDFTYNDDSGAPNLMLAENAPQTTWSLKPFLTLPETVSIPPRQSQTIDIGVSIPAEQGAGSYYSAILYSSGAPEGGNVGLSASGVTLVFTSIPGDVDENLKLENFGAYHPAASGREAGYTFITGEKPLNMAYTLLNSGNVTESPVGSIKLRHMFGSTIDINDVNPNSSLALIGQSRTFTACIKIKAEEVDFNGSRAESKSCAEPDLWPGLYTAELNLFYGQNGNPTQEITGTAMFWYMPLWFVAVLIIVLAIAAYFIWRLVRVIRRVFFGVPYGRAPSKRRRR